MTNRGQENVILVFLEEYEVFLQSISNADERIAPRKLPLNFPYLHSKVSTVIKGHSALPKVTRGRDVPKHQHSEVVLNNYSSTLLEQRVSNGLDSFEEKKDERELSKELRNGNGRFTAGKNRLQLCDRSSTDKEFPPLVETMKEKLSKFLMRRGLNGRLSYILQCF